MHTVLHQPQHTLVDTAKVAKWLSDLVSAITSMAIMLDLRATTPMKPFIYLFTLSLRLGYVIMISLSPLSPALMRCKTI